MHLNQGSAGGTRIVTLDDYPGITVVERWDPTERKTTRQVFYNDEIECTSIEDAVDKWTADHNKEVNQ